MKSAGVIDGMIIIFGDEPQLHKPSVRKRNLSPARAGETLMVADVIELVLVVLAPPPSVARRRALVNLILALVTINAPKLWSDGAFIIRLCALVENPPTAARLGAALA